MAYNLMLESSTPMNWTAVHRTTRAFNRMVEYFPIPSGAVGEPDALGVSVPMNYANEAGWAELRAVLAVLMRDHRLDVVDLYSGTRLGPSEIDGLRDRFIG